MDKSGAVRINLPITEVKVIGVHQRPAPDQSVTIAEDQSPAFVPPTKAVKIDKPLIAVKKLPTIGALASGGGDDEPKDGDGDGLVDDGTPKERPAPIDFPQYVPAQVSELWGQSHQQSMDKRLEAARRRRLPKGPRPSMGEIIEAFNNDDIDFIETLGRQLFEHEKLGKDGTYRSEVSNVSMEITDDGVQMAVIEGRIYDDSGIEVGYFIRDIQPFGDADSLNTPSIYHEELDMRMSSDDVRGQGIGSSFIIASELEYAAHGFERIHLTAGLSDGPRVWARDGYDWKDGGEREEFLLPILRQLNENGGSKYFSSPEELKAYRDMIQEALSQDFNDLDRLTPLHFALAPKFQQIVDDIKNRSRPIMYRGERPVRHYEVADEVKGTNPADQILMTGAGAFDKYDAVRNIRPGDTLKPQSRTVQLDVDEMRKTENKYVAELFAKIGLALDVEELDKIGGWEAAWEKHGEEILDAVSVAKNFTAYTKNGGLAERVSSEKLLDDLSGRYMTYVRFQLNEMAADIRAAKANKLDDKEYQARVLAFEKEIRDLEAMDPDSRDKAIRNIVARSLTAIAGAVNEQQKRHPELAERIMFNVPRQGADARVLGSTYPLVMKKDGGDALSLAHQFSLGQVVAQNPAFMLHRFRDGNFNVAEGIISTVFHEVGHMLDADNGILRTGIDPRSPNIIADINKKHPTLGDSLPGVMMALSGSTLTDLSAKIVDLPVGLSVDKTTGDVSSDPDSQWGLVMTLATLTGPYSLRVPVRVPGTIDDDFEPFLFSMKHQPLFADIVSHPRDYGLTPEKLIKATDLVKARKPAVKTLPDYVKDLSERLQQLLYEATNDLGITIQTRGDVLSELEVKTHGFTAYADTSVAEFIAEAHAMIELLQDVPGYKPANIDAKVFEKVRTLYEAMLDPERKFDIGIPKSVQGRIREALEEAQLFAKDLLTAIGNP